MVSLVLIFSVTVVAFALVVGLMAVGVMLGRHEIKGSCGGLGASQGVLGESPCSLCSNPKAECSEVAQEAGVAVARTDSAKDALDAEECDRQCDANACSPAEREACNRG